MIRPSKSLLQGVEVQEKDLPRIIELAARSKPHAIGESRTAERPQRFCKCEVVFLFDLEEEPEGSFTSGSG